MRKLVSLLGAGLLLTAIAAPAEATTPPAPFSQCPPVGADSECGVLLTINPDGSVTVTGSGQGPFDGVEDTLIGVQNNSAVSVPMLSLSGNSSPFAFEGDGLCAYIYCSYPNATGYEGPNTSFSNYGPTGTSGDVNFLNGGIPSGGSAYFSLEGAVTAQNLVITPPTPTDPPISATGNNTQGTEGAALTGAVATITDPDTTATASEYTATIDWGDGTTPVAGTVSGPTGGPFTVTGTHAYAEEGAYTVTASITDTTAPANTATATSNATITDAALTATGIPQLLSTNPVQQPVATFTDADPNGTVSDYTASINWGDGTAPTPGTITGSGTFSVSGNHTYSTLGPQTITTTITDQGGSTATATTQAILYATSAGGNFVVADTAATPGATVTFWGSQWATTNQPSGGAAPNSFKGFAPSPQAPSCSANWSSGTGNSTNGPTTVPTYMAVIVTSSATQTGSTIAGNTTHVVIIRTAPGYANNPGHPGTGQVVATLC